MWSSLLGLGIVAGLGFVYILAFRINNKGRKNTGGCGGGCGGCSGCGANQELKDVIK